MVRRILSVAAVWLVLLIVPSTGIASAQDDASNEDEEVAEPASYGDAELIEVLTEYDLLDEWIAASPVSPQASLVAVTNGGYLDRRQRFLNAIDTWATQTERLRRELARLDAAQARIDQLRAAVVTVRDALVLDDRLRGPESDTLVAITAALGEVATPEPTEEIEGPSEDPATEAEILLRAISERAGADLEALNSSTAAVTKSGVTAFAGFDGLLIDLQEAEQLVNLGRVQVRPAQEEGERLAASSLAQIPALHDARMLAATEIDGLSVVTIDAYIRAAKGVSCSVDWALLAGIGRIESNHGRLGGGSVSWSGQVSPEIYGPLLDGGASEVAEDVPDVMIRSWWASVLTQVATPWARGERAFDVDPELEAPGNGFAVVVDSDGGRLDGNDEWDRAVGPMQFIPETWSKWATDGNGDGVADPHNLYDAAASAARFLCHLQETRGSSPSTFLLGYNDSRSYARSVIATADRLRSASLPTD